MSCLIDIDSNSNISEEEIKTFVSKNNLYCHNCNKKGHMYKTCCEPKISNGIIAFNIKDFKKSLTPILEKFIKKNYNCLSLNDVKIDMNNINPNIKFLMVQRKHSLGFLEFIRGKYNANNQTRVLFLIEQMTPEEIYNITKYEFDDLWNNVWNNNEKRESTNKNINHQKEYILSKQKFY